MAVSLTTLTGPIYMPNGATPVGGKVSFELSSWDREVGEALIVSGPTYSIIDENGQFSVSLFTTTEGVNTVNYKMYVLWEDSSLSQSYVNDTYVYAPTPHYTKKYIGSFALAGAGPFRLSDLNIVSELEANSFDVLLECQAYALSAQASSTAAQNAASDAEAAATILEAFAVPDWGTFTINPAIASGRGPYLLPYNPMDVAYVELELGGETQIPTDDFTLIGMTGGTGILFTFDITAPLVAKYKLQRPLAADPNATVLTPEQFMTEGGTDAAAIQAAIAASNGRLVQGIPGATYTITQTVSNTGNVNLDLSMSKVLVTGDIQAFEFKAPTIGPFELTADYNYSASPLTLAVAALDEAPKAGQIVWIASKARDPGDRDNGSSGQQYRVGEAFRLGAGSTVSSLVLQAPLAFYEGIEPNSINDKTITTTGAVTVANGETLTQATSGATGVVVGAVTAGTVIRVSPVSGSFNTTNQLTGSVSGALGANSVPVSIIGFNEARVPSYTIANDTRFALPDMEARCSIRLPLIEYEDGHDADGWSATAVSVWGYLNPVIETGGVSRGYGAAVRVWGTYGAQISGVNVRNLTDDAPNQLGYGVSDGGWNTRVDGLTAHNVRHAHTSSKSTSSFSVGTFDAWKVMTFGRTVGGQIVGGIASGGVSALWNTHQDAQDVLFDGNVADGGGSAAFSMRGRNIVVANAIIRNCKSGIHYFNEYDSGDTNDDIYNNGKLVSDFTSGMIISPHMDVQQACIDVRASTVVLAGAGRYRSKSGCVIYNAGATLAIGGTHRIIADGALVATNGAALLHIGGNNAYSAAAFPEPNVVIDGVVEIDARGWTGAALTAVKTDTGTKLIIRGILRLLLPAGSTLFNGLDDRVICEGVGRIEYSIAGSSGIVTGLSARPIYLVDLTSGAIMDGTTRRNDYYAYTQITEYGPNSVTVKHGATTAGGLRLECTNTAVSDGQNQGGITFYTNDLSRPALEAFRILERGNGSTGLVNVVHQRNAGAGLLDAFEILSNGSTRFYNSDGTTVGVTWDAATQTFVVAGTGGVRLGSSSGPLVKSGTGTPEAAVTAPIGSLFLRTDGGAGTTLYVKQTGTGNTGWVGK